MCGCPLQALTDMQKQHGMCRLPHHLRPQPHLEPVRRRLLERPGAAHIAGGKDAWNGRLHLLIDDDAAVSAAPLCGN